VSLDYYEALQLANALSRFNGLEECYALANCTTEEHFPGSPVTVCGTVASTQPNLYACRGVRLLTTVEWEYAARAGTTTSMYAGEATAQPDQACHPDPVADEIGWYCANQDGGHLFAGGLKKPNRWGLFDMAGNAIEWVNEAYDADWYHRMPAVDPWEVYKNQGSVLVRGGAVTATALTLRSASRLLGPPWALAGFRLVRSITADADTPPVFPSTVADAGPD
jgi:hypothetical protein